MARPLLLFSAAIALASLALGLWTRPWANRGIESVTNEMARTRLTASLRAGVFNSWFGGVILFVDAIEQDTGMLRNVMLAEEREEFGRKTIFASDGRVESDDEADKAYLRLRSGEMLTAHPTGRYHDLTEFDVLDLNLNLAEETGLDPVRGGPAAMSLDRLLEERHRRLGRGESAVEETIELHRKLVLPAAVLLLPFLGVPLGSTGGRGVKARGVLVSSVVVGLYYLLLTGAVTVAREQIVPTAVAMWAPNLVLLLLAVLMFRRAASDEPLLPFSRWHRRHRRPV